MDYLKTSYCKILCFDLLAPLFCLVPLAVALATTASLSWFEHHVLAEQMRGIEVADVGENLPGLKRPATSLSGGFSTEQVQKRFKTIEPLHIPDLNHCRVTKSPSHNPSRHRRSIKPLEIQPSKTINHHRKHLTSLSRLACFGGFHPHPFGHRHHHPFQRIPDEGQRRRLLC